MKKLIFAYFDYLLFPIEIKIADFKLGFGYLYYTFNFWINYLKSTNIKSKILFYKLLNADLDN